MSSNNTGVASATPGTALAAYEYMNLGLRVLPLSGKVPLPGSRGVHDATTDPNKARWPFGTNVGIAMGDGLIALDVDRHHPSADGGRTLYELEQQHGLVPPSWLSSTGNSGEHIILSTEGSVQSAAAGSGPGWSFAVPAASSSHRQACTPSPASTTSG